MQGLAPRLGDLIDDYCPRCRLLLNHAIASMVEVQVAKVICQTCLTEHPYLYSDGSKRKKPPGGRQTLFDQVLAHSGPVAAPEAPTPKKKRSAPSARYARRHPTPKRRG